jgi:hypothetical protein
MNLAATALKHSNLSSHPSATDGHNILPDYSWRSVQYLPGAETVWLVQSREWQLYGIRSYGDHNCLIVFTLNGIEVCVLPDHFDSILFDSPISAHLGDLKRFLNSAPL